MPFGSHPFQDWAWVLEDHLGPFWSPMPFGSHPFQDVGRPPDNRRRF